MEIANYASWWWWFVSCKQNTHKCWKAVLSSKVTTPIWGKEIFCLVKEKLSSNGTGLSKPSRSRVIDTINLILLQMDSKVKDLIKTKYKVQTWTNILYHWCIFFFLLFHDFRNNTKNPYKMPTTWQFLSTKQDFHSSPYQSNPFHFYFIWFWKCSKFPKNWSLYHILYKRHDEFIHFGQFFVF